MRRIFNCGGRAALVLSIYFIVSSCTGGETVAVIDPPIPPPPAVQTCWDGTVIPVSQRCYPSPPQPPVVPPPPPYGGQSHAVLVTKDPSSLVPAQGSAQRSDGAAAGVARESQSNGEAITSGGTATGAAAGPATTRPGISSFSANPKMTIGITYPVKLAVGLKGDQALVIEASEVPDGQTALRDIKLGKWVCATLSAPQFKIVTGQKKQCKSVENRTTTIWEWIVQPQGPEGKHFLSATIDSSDSENGAIATGIESKKTEVLVELSKMDFLQILQVNLVKILGWLAGLLVALAGLKTAYNKLRNRTPPPPSSPNSG